MPLPKSCPQNDVWQQLLNETLAAEEEASLVTHLDHCTRCQHVLESLAGSSDLSGAVARHLSCHEQSDKEQLQPWIDRLKQNRLQLQTEVTEKPAGELLDFLEPTDDPDCLGSLGRYRVTQIVGQGGMGLVLKAIDPALSRVVAIKVLAPRLANDRTSRRRFLREARAAAAIAHDHVVTIYSVGKRGDTLYLEMQYIEGCSLQEKLEQQGRLDLAEILQIGLQTACGLAAAHACGLIHRDIKPANILLEQ
ncbi:MAG: serine/threonine-protein kinase, partial [Pirellulaceae bacterium]